MSEQIQIIRQFWSQNWKWFATVIFFAGFNFGAIKLTLDDKPTKEEVKNEITVTLESFVLPLVKRNAEDIKLMKVQASENLSISKEIKFNIKRLLPHQGLNYIEDTN